MPGRVSQPLSNQRDNTVYLWCKCGHQGSVRINDVLRFRREIKTTEQLHRKMKCTDCGRVGWIAQVRYVFDHPTAQQAASLPPYHLVVPPGE